MSPGSTVNDVVANTTGSRIIPEIDMAAARTRSNIQHIGQLETKFQRLYIHIFVEPGLVENMGIAVGILSVGVLELKITIGVLRYFTHPPPLALCICKMD